MKESLILSVPADISNSNNLFDIFRGPVYSTGLARINHLLFPYGNVCIVVLFAVALCSLPFTRVALQYFNSIFIDHLNSNIGLYFVITKVLSKFT